MKRFKTVRLRFFIFAIGLGILPLIAQPVRVPNGSFEEGEGGRPRGWMLMNGIGAWENDAQDGKKSISFTGDGIGSPQWRSEPITFAPNTGYRLSMWVKVAAGASPQINVGITEVRWSFKLLQPGWQRYEFYFKTGEKASAQPVNLLMWHHRGKVIFDNIQVIEANPVYATFGDIELGDAESVQGTVYHAGPNFSEVTGVAPPGDRILLEAPTSRFSGRWYVKPEGVVFKHNVGAVPQESAWINFRNGWNPRGTVVVSASNDGKNFTTFHETRKLYWNGPLQLPKELFPAKEIYIRFQAIEKRDSIDKELTGRDGLSSPLVFELTGYEYCSILAEELPEMRGNTRYLPVTAPAKAQ